MQGFFGKIPSHGDFVTRNLPRGFLDVWDEWLQRAVAASKSHLGDAWLETYLNSPVWRFVLLPGVCGDDGWAGILMPSVDRVGRYFPLTIATSLDGTTQPFEIASGGGPWFSAAETLALQVLDVDKLDAEELEMSVDGLDDSILRENPDAAPTVAGGQWGLRLMGGTESKLPSAVCHELVRFQVGDYSLWWTPDSGEFETMALIAPNLPDPLAFSSLLAGSWGDTFDAEALSADADPVETMEQAS